MRNGIPLNDTDRAPWLDRLAAKLALSEKDNHTVILACSALKIRYRRQLTRGLKEVQIVYLKGKQPLLRARMSQRKEHFMTPSLLISQINDLEEPIQEEALILDCRLSIDELVERIIS
jgi:gluconokinase